jgi:hypothetical protein
MNKVTYVMAATETSQPATPAPVKVPAVRKPKIDFDNVRLQAITCGIIDARYGECLYGTHHAVVNGRTLCGQRGCEREGRTTMWFSLESLHSLDQADEFVTCNRCRKSMGFKPVRDSQILL